MRLQIVSVNSMYIAWRSSPTILPPETVAEHADSHADKDA